MGTFENISPTAANSGVLRVQTQSADIQPVIPLFRNMCSFRKPKNRFFGPKCQDLFCRKGLPGSRRGRFCRATGPLLQCRKAPARTPGGPYGKTGALPPHFQCLSSVLKRDFHLSPFFAQQCLQQDHPEDNEGKITSLKDFLNEFCNILTATLLCPLPTPSSSKIYETISFSRFFVLHLHIIYI